MLMIFSRPDIFGQKSWGSFGPYFRNPHRAPDFAGSALLTGWKRTTTTERSLILDDEERRIWIFSKKKKGHAT
jgi:hypothetical protein